MEKKYLFQRSSDRLWVFGNHVKSDCKAGLYRIDVNSEGTSFLIRAVYNRDIIENFPARFNDYLKENEEEYSSFDEFHNATKKFFHQPSVSISDPDGTIIYPSGISASVQTRLTRPNDVAQYSVNDSINSSIAAPVSLNLANMVMAPGRGGYLMEIDATTNMLNLADGTIRLWFYRTEPTGMVGDNLPMINSDENTTKGRHYIDIKFNSLLSDSTVLIAQKSVLWNFVCDAASKDLKLRIQALTAFTPVANGFIDLAFIVTQQ